MIMINMRLLAITVLALTSSAALADGTYHKVQIPGWTVQTSEYFEQGTRLKASYPLYNLFDGKPSTAWVYNDLDYPKPRNIDGLAKPGRYYVEFAPDSPTVIDELSSSARTAGRRRLRFMTDTLVANQSERWT
jgi:hypothetical protein